VLLSVAVLLLRLESGLAFARAVVFDSFAKGALALACDFLVAAAVARVQAHVVGVVQLVLLLSLHLLDVWRGAGWLCVRVRLEHRGRLRGRLLVAGRELLHGLADWWWVLLRWGSVAER